MSWDKVDKDERVAELYSARSEALGILLGCIDMILLAGEHPDVFKLVDKLIALRAARAAYDLAAAAYLDARLTR